MESITNNKNFKYFAIIPFAILILYELTLLGSYSDSDFFATVTMIAGFIMVVTGLIISKPIVSSAGFALTAATSFLGSFGWFSWYMELVRITILYNAEPFLTSVNILRCMIILLNVVTYILLAVACVKSVYTKKLGLIAAIISIVTTVLFFIGDIILNPSYSYPFTTPAWGILNALGALLVALAYDYFYINGMEVNPAIVPTTQPAISQTNTEKLIKLKQLLDTGIITQEEFDEKKKQLLDL